MAGSCARRSPCRNLPPIGADKIAGAAPTKGSDTPTQAFVVARASIPYSAIAMAKPCACRSPRQNPSSARTTLTPLEPVILIERLPTWFHVRISAPNRLNVRRGPIFFKRPLALHHGLKWNSAVENWTAGTSYLKDLQHHVVMPQRSDNAKTAEGVL